MDEQFEIYCVRCKKKTPQNDSQIVLTKNERKARKGTCSVCGAKTQQFLSTKEPATSTAV